MTGRPETVRLSAPETARPWSSLVTERLRGVLAARIADPVLWLIAPVLIGLGLWKLDRYPRTWFDEGMYLQVAKNFAHDGLYAVRSADGTIDYAPIIGVGPTVLMPAALAMRLGGASLFVARIVPLLALLIASYLFYLLGRALFGRLAAGCALLLLLCSPAIEWLATGRQLLGEVPAVTLLLAGAILSWRAGAQRAPLLGGLCFGLTMVTKGQYLLILPAAICATALFDRLFTRQRPLRWYMLLLGTAIITYGGWIVALLLFLNHGQILENYRQLRASSGGALLVFNRERMVAALRFLLGPRTLFLVAPTLLGGLWLCWQASGARRLAIAALWIFQAGWLGWFAFASIAWPRYAFPGLVINTLFMGALVALSVQVVQERLQRQQPWTATALANGLLVAGVVLVVCRGGWLALAPLARGDQREPQLFAREVERLVPAGVAIDGWEPEVGFLAERPIQHPPLGTLDRVVRARWLGTGGAPLDLSGQLQGQYLIVGPFGHWVGIYNAAITSTNYRLIARVGEYELYQRLVGGALVGPESEGR